MALTEPVLNRAQSHHWTGCPIVSVNVLPGTQRIERAQSLPATDPAKLRLAGQGRRRWAVRGRPSVNALIADGRETGVRILSGRRPNRGTISAIRRGKRVGSQSVDSDPVAQRQYDLGRDLQSDSDSAQ